LENRSGGGGNDAPDDGNRVRFLPSGSSDPRKPRKRPILESSITPSKHEDSALGFSSGFRNRSGGGGGDDAPDDGNLFRFRPSGSSDRQGSPIPGPSKTHPRKAHKRRNGVEEI